MEEEESLATTDSVSTLSKKESGYFEENCGDLSDVIFSNYNHYGALLSVDTAGILIVNETRRSDNWEESRQGSSFSSGLVEDINDLDVNDSDEAKDDVVSKHPEKAKCNVVGGSKELACTREGSSTAVLCTPGDSVEIVNSETPLYIHEDSKAVLYVREDSKAVYIHESSEIIEENSTNVECATSPSIIVEDWDNVEISDTGKTTIPADDNDVTSSSYGCFRSREKSRLFVTRTLLAIDNFLVIAGLLRSSLDSSKTIVFRLTYTWPRR